MTQWTLPPPSRISRPGTHAIIVSGYESIEWTISAEAGAEIEAIYAVGVKPQKVNAPAGIQVVSENKQSGDPYGCADGYPTSSVNCTTSWSRSLPTSPDAYGGW